MTTRQTERRMDRQMERRETDGHGDSETELAERQGGRHGQGDRPDETERPRDRNEETGRHASRREAFLWLASKVARSREGETKTRRTVLAGDSRRRVVMRSGTQSWPRRVGAAAAEEAVAAVAAPPQQRESPLLSLSSVLSWRRWCGSRAM